ncbi:glycoside hydrolase family 10 protein [Prevotella sp.]|uniref:glycoside hydrolase family 10 protein n=1 Tax=Prevotella sp. TaxID=59823 RepID=UPI003077D5C3
MRYIYTLVIILLASLCAVAQPKHEVRAVWLTTIGGIDWPHSYAQSARSIERQKDELRHILDQLQQVGINTVLLQTRVRGTMIYPSDYEPWDGCLSGFPGKNPGYDALKFAIDECHKRGMELHAWMVTIPLGKWDALGCRQLRKKMPRNIIKIKADGYLNPESQQTADYLAGLCAEVTKRYDIDGIHLDYIRYPEDMPKLKTLDRQCGRNNITRIVSAISRRVKSLKPWVKMSCSPIGKYDNTTRYWSHGWNANTTVCQDAVAWLRDGLMDELFPMMYFRDNHFFPFALDWKEQSHGRIVVPGLGIYFMSPRERDWPLSDITRELEVLRHIGLGHAYFRSKFFTDDTKGIYTYAKNNFCRYPSLVPPMTWASRHKPEMPYGLSLSNVANNVAQLSWHHAEKDTTMMMFNIYASKKYPVDTEDARNLVAIRRQGRQLLVPNDGCTYYAVTATDRYGNESRALQEDAPYGEAETQCGSTRLLRCDGKKVEVPNKAHIADTEYLLVESLQGIAVATLPYNGSAETINISTLKNGMYQMRSLNRKGMSHRLGMFIIKR